MKIITRTRETEFAKDVFEGLSQSPKTISSKYFYDKKGDHLFQKIMHLPSYYLTRAEFEIFLNQADNLVEELEIGSGKIEVVEFGAGDGTKTMLLLKELIYRGVEVTYRPVDISANVLDILEGRVHEALPKVHVEPLVLTYEKAVKWLIRHQAKASRLLLFLGSNLGNLEEKDAQEFLNGISSGLRSGDHLLIGLDKKKEPELILDAYNDPEGITAEFNLNLLDRMNRELGTNFDRNSFSHQASYDPETGTAKSFLISMRAQTVHLPIQNACIQFEAFETIHTEISQKYDRALVQKLFNETELLEKARFEDENELFADYLFIKG